MNNIIYTIHRMNNQQKKDFVTLEILQTIEIKSDITQRHLANKLDVALGLANSYLKRCVRKGLVKVQQAPANRYLYYLTPRGFTEKSRLTAEYLSASFSFYHQASDSLTDIFNDCEAKKLKRVVFFGVSELAEIASVRINEHDLSIVGTWDPENNISRYLNHALWNNYSDVPGHDVCILTALDKVNRYYSLLIDKSDKDKVMVPSILGITYRK